MKLNRGPKHPGVVLIKPEPNSGRGWRARYLDPDLERVVKVTLNDTLTNHERRAQWAATKSEALRKRRYELSTPGAIKATGTSLSEAVDRYFRAHPALGKRTIEGYRYPTKRFLEWAAEHRIRTTDDLDRAKLATYWETLVAIPKAVSVKNGKRGENAPSGKLRGPHAINHDLRSLGTILRFLAERDLFPRLRIEEIGRALKKVDTTLEEPIALKSAELNALLAAAKEHDIITFKMTRDDKKAGTKNTTGRYTPIYPLVLGMLLTGMRFDEAVSLEWSDVDLEDAVIKLKGAKVKTKRARSIDLAISPGLSMLLAELKPDPMNEDALVFGIAYDEAQAAGKRLRKLESCPKRFRWKALRSTCASYLTNAPGIYGAASAYRSAKQLGHSVVVAEKHYVGIVKVPKDATTVEAAMGLKLVVENDAAE